jgi:hypothetical protein
MSEWGPTIALCISLIGSAYILTWKGFFTGYGSKKGGNRADSEDLPLTLNQLRKQKHEDMKREQALDIMRAYGTLLEACADLFRTGYRRPKNLVSDNIIDVDADQRKAAWDTASDKFQAGLTTFWQLEQIARLIFPEAIWKQMDVLKKAFIAFRSGMYDDVSEFGNLYSDLENKQEVLSKRLKDELQI